MCPLATVGPVLTSPRDPSNKAVSRGTYLSGLEEGMRWLCHPGGTKRDWTNGDLVPSYEEALGILELLTLILVCTIPDLAKLGWM